MDTWGALASNVMSRDDLSIRRKTGIVSSSAKHKWLKKKNRENFDEKLKKTIELLRVG